MVGVAGGSKGCLECKRRKVKCDETIPQCIKCKKRGLICSGAITGPLFRRQKIGTADRIARIETQGERNSLSLSQHKSLRKLGPSLRIMRHNLRKTEKQVEQSKSSFDLADMLASPSENLPMLIPLRPSDKDMLQFCDSYFMDSFAKLTSHIPNSERRSKLWFQFKISHYIYANDNSVTSFAGKALVLIYAASSLHDDHFRHEGIKWYIKALKMQRMLLRNIHCVEASKDESLVVDSDGNVKSTSICRPVARIRSQDAMNQTIMASFLFTMLEIVSPSLDYAWIALMRGSLDILSVIGPQIDDVECAFGLFEGLRISCAIASISLRQDSFLSSPEWMSIPFNNRRKDDVQVLIDMMLEFAQILQQMSLYLPADYTKFSSFQYRKTAAEMSASKSAKEKINAIYKLYKSLNKLEGKLDALFESYKSQVEKRHIRKGDTTKQFDRNTGTMKGEYSVCPLSEDTNEWCRTHFFKPPVEYLNVDDCHLVNLYYTFRSLLGTSIMAALPFKIMETTGNQSYWDVLSSQEYKNASAEHNIQINRNISVICRSSKYVMTRGATFMMIRYLFPICVAYDLVTNTLEGLFIRDLLEEIQSLGVGLGMGMGVRLDTLGLKLSTSSRSTPNQDRCSSCGEVLKAHGMN
ncbi:hypothetical protein V1511DRAFT_501569 [Dipodascopsis uninucleata]